MPIVCDWLRLAMVCCMSRTPIPIIELKEGAKGREPFEFERGVREPPLIFLLPGRLLVCFQTSSVCCQTINFNGGANPLFVCYLHLSNRSRKGGEYQCP